MIARDDAKQVGETILSQLGGRRFVAMTGARDFVIGEGGDLRFRLPIGNWNVVKIELTPMDVYRVTFQKGRRKDGVFTVSREQVHEDIYCDMLEGLVSRETGLATRL